MVRKVLVNTGLSHSISPDGTEPQPDQMLTIDLRYPNIFQESGNVATPPLKHSLPTHIISTGRYQTFQNDFNVRFIAYG